MSLVLPLIISQPHCYLSCFQGDPWWNAAQHISSPESAEGSEDENSDSEETDYEETESNEEKNEEDVEGTTLKSFINTQPFLEYLKMSLIHF